METEASKLQRYISNLIELGPEPDEEVVRAGDVRIDLFRRIGMASSLRSSP